MLDKAITQNAEGGNSHLRARRLYIDFEKECLQCTASFSDRRVLFRVPDNDGAPLSSSTWLRVVITDIPNGGAAQLLPQPQTSKFIPQQRSLTN